jgi:hypothetical protein
MSVCRVWQMSRRTLRTCPPFLGPCMGLWRSQARSGASQNPRSRDTIVARSRRFSELTFTRKANAGAAFQPVSSRKARQCLSFMLWCGVDGAPQTSDAILLRNVSSGNCPTPAFMLSRR